MNDFRVALNLIGVKGWMKLKRLMAHSADVSNRVVSCSVSVGSRSHVSSGKRQDRLWVCLAERRLVKTRKSEE